MKGMKTAIFTGLLALFFLSSNRIYCQRNFNGVEKTSLDFRFILQSCDSSEFSRCNNFKGLSITVYSIINDSLIDKLYFRSDPDSFSSEDFLQINDFNFDGHTDFRILTRKSKTLVEKTMGCPDYINDYDFYMFDVSNNKFYRHLISSLRKVKIDPIQKNATGTLFNKLNNSSSSAKQPTSYLYKFNGEGLKYCTISALSYSYPHNFGGSFQTTYQILEGRTLRTVNISDTLTTTPIVKYDGGFKFVKIRQIYPPKVDIDKSPNISYRNIYRIYSLTNDQLLAEIIGTSEGLFDTHSDSIHTADCNFDGYPDLIIKDADSEIYRSIYFYNIERQKFYEYPNIKQLENLSVNFQSKTITGKNTTQAFERNKHGQLREPKKRIWSEFEFIGPSLKYVKMQTITFTQKRGRNVKTTYYINDNNAFTPIRKKKFLSLSNNQ